MSLSEDDVIQIMRYLNESKFQELHLEMGDLKLVLSRNRVRGPLGDPAISSNCCAQSSVGRDSAVSHGDEPVAPIGVLLGKGVEQREGGDSERALENNGWIPIRSPMLGTFYRAPKPDDPPFVEVGRVVSEEDTVCIIEVMKLYSAIKAGLRGRIAKICAEDGQMVEYDQILFLVEAETD